MEDSYRSRIIMFSLYGDVPDSLHNSLKQTFGSVTNTRGIDELLVHLQASTFHSIIIHCHDIDLLFEHHNYLSVKEIAQQKHIPLLFSTGRLNDDIMLKTFDLGMSDCWDANCKEAVIIGKIKNRIREKLHYDVIKSKHIKQLQHSVELEKANRIKNKLMSIIAHDLRSPIGNFAKLFELLLNGEMAVDEEILEGLYLSSSKMNDLVTNLLTWAQLDSGRQSVKQIKCSLFDLVDENITLLQMLIQNKNIRIVNNVPEKTTLFADETMVSGIIRNLLTNAIKFSHEQGTITIAAKAYRHEKVQISISDTGMGMEPHIIEKIVNNTLDASEKGTYGEEGTGLGLLLCKEFIKKHGGKLYIESEIDKGSTFSFTMPASIHSPHYIV